MARLRRVTNQQPGFGRSKRGKGFSYLDIDGGRLTDQVHLGRIASLVIPPAWDGVWICQYANGHIQATGFDAKGRLQYRYHDEWRRQRDLMKFDAVQTFGQRLPKLRAKVIDDMDQPGFGRDRILACAARLLDLGFFRIGGEDYAAQNETYGLATIRKSHVKLRSNSELVFDYTAKSSKHRVQAIVDPEVYEIVKALKNRRGGGVELLAYKRGQTWVDVKSADINEYVKSITGNTFSAKWFRTWNATVLAAVALAVSEQTAATESAKKRAVARAVTEVSEYLGNTPAVARASYIDPVVIDRFYHGKTIANSLDKLGRDVPVGHPATHGAIEKAVLKLLA